MTVRNVPAATTAWFDYAAWARENVQAGDEVVFPEGSVYWTEAIRLTNPPPHKIIGNGVRLVSIAGEFRSHRYVDHSSHEYVRREADAVITTNHAEGYFSQLKRSLDGTHHHVSVEHLPRYLAEFDYRYSTRQMSDTERTHDLFAKVDGKRLTYRPLTER